MVPPPPPPLPGVVQPSKCALACWVTREKRMWGVARARDQRIRGAKKFWGGGGRGPWRYEQVRQNDLRETWQYEGAGNSENTFYIHSWFCWATRCARPRIAAKARGKLQAAPSLLFVMNILIKPCAMYKFSSHNESLLAGPGVCPLMRAGQIREPCSVVQRGRLSGQPSVRADDAASVCAVASRQVSAVPVPWSPLPPRYTMLPILLSPSPCRNQRLPPAQVGGRAASASCRLYLAS